MSVKYLKNNSLCPLPFAGAIVNTDGDVQCCSISKESLGNVNDNTLEHILNTSEKLKEIKNDMLENKYPYNCSDCYQKEKYNKDLNFENISNRLYHIKTLKAKPFKLYEDPSIHELQQIDLRWRNTCNFACVYCDSTFSSVWAKFEGAKDKMSNKAMQETLEFVEKNIKNLTTIYMAGGEPFLIKENLKIIDLIKQHNPDLLLRINTNLSMLTPKIYKQLSTMKNVHWILSAESTDKKFGYIRWPGKYETFKANLEKIRTLPHKITFNMTWNVLCASNILDFIDDMLKLGIHPNSFVMNFVSDPMFYNIGNISEKQRKKLVENIGQRLEKQDHKFYLYKVYKEMLDKLNEPLLDEYAKELYNNLTMIDKQRNLNSKEIFPELYEEVLN
jgi:radical SAM protein with 4Fe4S-binding SPASM domain